MNAAFDKAGMGSVRFDGARIAAAAILGGTISDATGGKFANGAMTAAMGQALNGNQQNARTQVELGYKKLGTNPLTGEDYHHAYVKVTGPNGEVYYIRGGPSGSAGNPSFVVTADGSGSGSSAAGAFGNLEVIDGDSARYLETMQPDAALTTALTTDRSFESVVSRLQEVARAVNAAKIPYLPLSTNSNAFAHQAVASLGVARPAAAVYSPGSDQMLRVTISGGWKP